MKENKIVLNDVDPGMAPDSEEMAKIVITRLGLLPRKKGSTEKMHIVLIELYERSKRSNQNKNLEEAVMTVEEMALYAGITRQTMYEYLDRWLGLNLIIKTSYIKDNKVVIGYKLNGATLEMAFEKAQLIIKNHLETTLKYVKELQRYLKNEKIRQSQKKENTDEQKQEEDSTEKEEAV